MSILILSPSEMYTLSLLASKPPQKLSPVKKLYLDKKENLKDHKVEYLEIMAKFHKDGLIWFDQNKNPHLIREIEAVCKTIHLPMQVFHIKRLGSTDVKEHYYCKKGKLDVLYSVGKDEMFHTLMYPVPGKALSQWFAEDLLKDVSFSEEQLPTRQMELDAGEMLMIWLMKAALDKKAESVTLEVLTSPENAKNLRVGEIFPFDEKSLHGYLDQPDKMETVLEGMTEKGIVAKNEEKYSFSPLFRDLFNPEKIQDILTISNLGAFSQTKYLYLLKGGYMLLEGIIYDPVSWKINIFPGNMDKQELFDIALTWEEIRMGKAFKENVVKQLAAEAAN